MEKIKKCPIEGALDFIRNKWSFEIIRDLFMGKRRFKDFLDSNPKLSNNVLSDRLKELMDKGLIEKKVNNNYKIEYHLTQKGKDLNKVLYELAVFAMKHAEGCLCQGSHFEQLSKFFKRMFRVKEI